MTALNHLFDQVDWEEDALCRQIDGGDMFFPEKGESTMDAKRVCRACPVATQCLQDALERRELFGVWGGKSPNERKRILKLAGIVLDDDDTANDVAA